MINEYYIIIAISLISFMLYRQSKKDGVISKLFSMLDNGENDTDWEAGEGVLKNLGDRFGKAGFISKAERQIVLFLCYGVVGIGIALGLFWGIVHKGTVVATIVASIIGAYLAVLIVFVFLKYSEEKFKQQVLFQIPIVLESMILLIESGCGVVPALEKVTSGSRVNSQFDSQRCFDSKVIRLFRLVYQLTVSGLTFSQALEKVANATDIKVLRHVLIYLDVSASEGGELVPALQSLSGHTHTEWKMTIEGRVKRLESLVVFPVFFAVIGLTLLIAAVPILPVLNINDKLSTGIELGDFTR